VFFPYSGLCGGAGTSLMGRHSRVHPSVKRMDRKVVEE
jgi:hypothetical protein